MKKTLILMAAASAFVLTGCTETDLSGDTSLAKESSSAIEFSAKTRNAGATRATGGTTGDITTTTLTTGKHKNDGFGVMAYMKGTNGATDCYTGDNWNNEKPNFMYNQQVTYSTDHWTYSPVKFWPNDFSTGNVDAKQGEAGEDYNATGSVNSGKVSFFAYAPYVAIQDYSATPATDLGTTVNSAFKTYVSSENPSDGIVAISSNAYTGEPQVKYVLSNASLTNAVDLLWGVRPANTYTLADGGSDTKDAEAYNTDLTKQAANETIDFLFKHALAKIGGHTYEDPNHQTGLQVILDLDNGSLAGGVQPSTAITGGVKQPNTLVTVESIKIRDLKTYSDEITGSLTSDLIKSGWFNIATGKWTENDVVGATYNHEVNNLKTEGDDKFELNAAIKEPTTKTGMTYETGSSTWTTNGTTTIAGVVTDTPTDVYTTESNAPGLVLIPSTTENQTLVVTVKYIVRTFDDHLATTANNDGANGTWTKVEQTITNKVTIPAGSLKSNKFYKLLIHLGLTSVKFSATVAAWEENTNDPNADNEDEDNNKEIYLPSNTIASTVTAGSTTTANVTAATTGYTIKVTGLTNTNTVTVTGTNNAAGKVSITPATITDGTATVSVTGMTANGTASPVDNVITIIEKNSGDEVITTTKVTITQAAAVVTP